MIPMTVHRVVMNQQGNAFVLLQDATGERLLPILIGWFEAQAIAMKLEDAPFDRPLTHDLFHNTLSTLGYELTKIEITKLEDRIFYAMVYLYDGEVTTAVDSRPSDALALAVRADADIYVAESVLSEAQVLRHEIDESAEVEKFRELVGGLDMTETTDAMGDDTEHPEPDPDSTEDDQ